MDRRVIIIGASGHGKVIADIVRKSGDQVLGFLDDNRALPKIFFGFPVIGTVAEYKEHLEADFIVAIGDAQKQKKIVKELEGVSWYTAVHPSAVISDIQIRIGAGTAVMANAVINSCAGIGEHCIINSSAVVEHDNQIEDFVHISVGAKLAGNVTIGKGTWIGIGASVSNNLEICGGCMIGAGAAVVQNIREAGVYVGTPAKKKK